MPEGGKLTLEAANVWVDDDYSRANPEIAQGQYVSISVTDTGTGMTPDTQSHAFEPFFTTKEVGRGTGLGLSQVYGFVKQSGGHVKIYSELGQGTTIKLYFPRYTGKDILDENPIETGATSTDFHETILIVEDDPDLRTYLGDVLRGLKYRVLTTPNANTALALLQQEGVIDLLLTDIVMPGMNGRELADKAKLLRPDMLVLYMTGYSRNAVIHQGRLDEGVSLIQKPVSQAELAHRVRLMLDKAVQKK
jgi:CheY-like chemotaxis protein